MKKTLKIAIFVSVTVHAAAFLGIAGWSLISVAGIGGGEGMVEVGIVGSEGVKAQALPVRTSLRNSMTTDKVSEALSEPKSDYIDGHGGGGGTGGGDGGTGFGVGDPRLTQIWKKINRAKYYPEMARRDGAEGAPKIAFSISEDGKVGGVKIVQSSGNEVLDNAAIEAIQNSAPLPFYPQPITIAVRYSLKDH